MEAQTLNARLAWPRFIAQWVGTKGLNTCIMHVCMCGSLCFLPPPKKIHHS